MTTLFPPNVMLAYLAAVLIVVIAPGPDNLLAISRGLSQGKLAGALSSLGAGMGIMVHATATAFGLALVLQTSPLAFWVVKLVGAGYLIWLGWKAMRARNLISFTPTARLPLRRVFVVGLLSNVLNPKPGLFVVAFIPQFVSAARGPVALQVLGYGLVFALLTFLIFSVLGAFAAQLAGWLARRPRAVVAANVGAGLTFIAAGVSILALDRRH